MRFRILTRDSGDEVLVNTDHIIHATPNRNKTSSILLQAGERHNVALPLAQLCDLLNNGLDTD